MLALGATAPRACICRRFTERRPPCRARGSAARLEALPAAAVPAAANDGNEAIGWSVPLASLPTFSAKFDIAKLRRRQLMQRLELGDNFSPLLL